LNKNSYWFMEIPSQKKRRSNLRKWVCNSTASDVCLNIEESTSKSLIDDFTMFAHEKGRLSLVVNAELESEISSLEPGEQKAFLEEYGIAEPAVVRLAKTLYDLWGFNLFLPLERRKPELGL